MRSSIHSSWVGLQKITWIVIGCTIQIKEPEGDTLFEREMTDSQKKKKKREMTKNTLAEALLPSLIYRMCVQNQPVGRLFWHIKTSSAAMPLLRLELQLKKGCLYRTKTWSPALSFFQVESAIVEKLLRRHIQWKLDFCENLKTYMLSRWIYNERHPLKGVAPPTT
jgi:hypothetical protein